MTIDGKSVPIGKISLSFEYFADDDPPYAWLNIHSDSDNHKLGGLAINCLDVGSVANLESLVGKTLSFTGDDESGAELRESVFWRPGDQTLELQALSVTVESITEQGAQLKIESTCFDHDGNTGIRIVIHGTAEIHR
jgi:hypothetical protein